MRIFLTRQAGKQLCSRISRDKAKMKKREKQKREEKSWAAGVTHASTENSCRNKAEKKSRGEALKQGCSFLQGRSLNHDVKLLEKPYFPSRDTGNNKSQLKLESKHFLFLSRSTSGFDRNQLTFCFELKKGEFQIIYEAWREALSNTSQCQLVEGSQTKHKSLAVRF